MSVAGTLLHVIVLRLSLSMTLSVRRRSRPVHLVDEIVFDFIVMSVFGGIGDD